MSGLYLPRALEAWNTPAFAVTLQDELAALGPGALPLQQGLATSSRIGDSPIQAMLLGADAHAGHIAARVGIFFSGIVAGCSCADDPTPVSPQPEYCVLLLSIDQGTAATTATLADD